ncbi:bacteriorhodopsin-like [Tunicatimonas pelagia]|uniref:bacteriorhodopsin-like n=1 Tax=Tunicatimonas pelagia TaxID=931531 RepID=UPI002666BC35|nr:bacteriorhodopsin-like [Tunicatimonas pelagia]WKN41545.1 bacteriorhodopsin-like [Tunicatimonas pelagia]
METLFLADIVEIPVDDPVAFTFFTGYMAMFAASIFFFFERSRVDGKWKLSLLISGLITGIAAVHYYYMRDYYTITGDNPTVLRYIDWTLTVPLMCVEFYLLLRPAGAKIGLMWRFIAAAVLMLVAGYIGEGFYRDNGTMNILWGVISTIGWAIIIYEIWFGSAKSLAAQTNSAVVKKGFKNLALFATIGWGIYPIGYMLLPGNLLSFTGIDTANMDLIYNIGDAVNKIGFGLVVYATAIGSSKSGTTTSYDKRDTVTA